MDTSFEQGFFSDNDFYGDIPFEDFPSGDIPSGDFPSGDFPFEDFPPGDFPPGDIPPGDFPSKDIPPGDLPPVPKTIRRIKTLVAILYNLLYRYPENRLIQKIDRDFAEKIKQWARDCFGSVENVSDPDKDDDVYNYYEFLKRDEKLPFNLLVTSPEVIRRGDALKTSIGRFSIAKKRSYLTNLNLYKSPDHVRIIRVAADITNYLMAHNTGCNIEFDTFKNSFLVHITNPAVFVGWMKEKHILIDPQNLEIKDIFIYCRAAKKRQSAGLITVPRIHRETNVVFLSYHTNLNLKYDRRRELTFYVLTLTLDLYKRENYIPDYKDYDLLRGRNPWSKYMQNMICASCGVLADNMFVCGDCQNQVYCGKACQKTDWEKRHAQECKNVFLK